MTNESLSGIERELVLQYLMDGNVPVTVTPLKDDTDTDKVHSVSSQIFPIALKSEHLKVKKSGKIELENPPQAVKSFEGEKVRVEFYFNRVGLYFYSKLVKGKNGLSFSVPDTIQRIKDEEETARYDFSAVLFFASKTKTEANPKCIPWQEEELFTRPAWKSIPLANQKKAKEYLEGFVEEAKKEKNAGNGLQLIPVCNYLTRQDEPKKVQSLQDRAQPYSILYIDHERIVIGTNDIEYVQGEELAFLLNFLIKDSPLSRAINVTAVANKIYSNEDNSLHCVDCTFTTIQEEDLRYLYEKATKRLFI